MDKFEIEGLVYRLFEEQGLDGWQFRWNSNKQRLGVCKYTSRRIELSQIYVAHNDRDHIIDTIRHEIAHAIAGPGEGHGPSWKEIATRLGAAPKSCSDDATMPQGNWQARCPGCGAVFTSHRRPRHLKSLHCKCCGPKVGHLKFKNVVKEVAGGRSDKIVISQMAIVFPSAPR